MKLQHNGTTRYGIGIALIGLALLGTVLLATSGAATAATVNHTVQITDPPNQSIEATVEFAGSGTATVALTSPDGTTTYDSASVTGAAGETHTLTLSAASAPAGEATLNMTVSDELNVTISSRSLVTEQLVTVDNATTQTLDVSTAYTEAASNATTDVTVADATGTTLLTDTLTYTGADSDGVLSASYNASDGLERGDLTVTVATSPAVAQDSTAIRVSAVNDATSGGGWMPDMSGIDLSLSAIPGGTAGLAGAAIVLVLLGAAVLGRN